MRKNIKRQSVLLLLFALFTVLLISGCKGKAEPEEKGEPQSKPELRSEVKESPERALSYPEYTGEAYVEMNGGIPSFTEEEITTEAFENYSDLDELGRCTGAIACVGTELMPTEKRERISEVKPSGWRSVRYDFVDRESLYNRSHLIAFQLTGENANVKNLITGTRFMNAEVMNPFEIKIGNYVRRTKNHVMYRVTPVFRGEELVARGVHMEALSVEDGGKGISFNIFCFNVQPGVKIDYKDGKSRVTGDFTEPVMREGEAEEEEETEAELLKLSREDGKDYVLNTFRKKIHLSYCESVKEANRNNLKKIKARIEELRKAGYTPCGTCRPK